MVVFVMFHTCKYLLSLLAFGLLLRVKIMREEYLIGTWQQKCTDWAQMPYFGAFEVSLEAPTEGRLWLCFYGVKFISPFPIRNILKSRTFFHIISEVPCTIGLHVCTVRNGAAEVEFVLSRAPLVLSESPDKAWREGPGWLLRGFMGTLLECVL